MLSDPDNNLAPQPSLWTAWSTTGYGILILGVFFAVQILVFIALSILLLLIDTTGSISAFQNVGESGFTMALAICASSFVCVTLILILLMQRNTPSIRQHLALEPVSLRTLAVWIAISLLLIIISDRLTALLERPVVPEFMLNTYKTAYVAPLFWFAVVVAAPVFEEIFFRGFLFEGFCHSRLRVPGTIVLTTFVWTVIHVQYDLYELSLVFSLGIFLGIARARTQSLLTPITIHAAVNLIATIQAMLEVGE